MSQAKGFKSRTEIDEGRYLGSREMGIKPGVMLDIIESIFRGSMRSNGKTKLVTEPSD